MMTSAKKDILLQSNKYKNKNTQLLNLSSNSAILPNMIFYGTKMCIRQVSAGCNFFRYKFRENCSQNKYEVSTLKIVQDSMNTRDLDKKSVGMPGTQPACVGKFSVVVLILLFTF